MRLLPNSQIMQLRIMRLLVCTVEYLVMFVGDVGDAEIPVVIETTSPTPEEELDTKPSY